MPPYPATGPVPNATPPPATVIHLPQQFVISAENLVQMLQVITNSSMAQMQQMQQSTLQHFAEMSQANAEIQQQLLQQMANPVAPDPLRKFREEDQQLPKFSGKMEEFMRWLLDVEDRKDQRRLRDHVAISYATVALGDFVRGIIPPGRQFPNWGAFVEFLRPLFQLRHAEWALFQETGRWKMNGDFLSYHSMVQSYQKVLAPELHPALMIHFIAGLDPHISRKVCKTPKPQSLDEALKRAWDAYHESDISSGQGPSPYPAHQQYHSPAIPAGGPSDMT